MTTQKASKTKAELQKIEVEKEEKYFMDPFYNTLWNQYEGSLTHLRESREQRLNACIKVIKETRKFNEEYRNALKGLFGEVKNFNHNLNVRTSSIRIAKSNDSIEVKSGVNQFEEAVNKFSELLSTPFNATFELIERVEEQFELASEDYIESLKEKNRVWSTLNDHYADQLRTAHASFNHHIEDRFKLMFSAVSK